MWKTLHKFEHVCGFLVAGAVLFNSLALLTIAFCDSGRHRPRCEWTNREVEHVIVASALSFSLLPALLFALPGRRPLLFIVICIVVAGSAVANVVYIAYAHFDAVLNGHEQTIRTPLLLMLVGTLFLQALMGLLAVRGCCSSLLPAVWVPPAEPEISILAQYGIRPWQHPADKPGLSHYTRFEDQLRGSDDEVWIGEQ